MEIPFVTIPGTAAAVMYMPQCVTESRLRSIVYAPLACASTVETLARTVLCISLFLIQSKLVFAAWVERQLPFETRFLTILSDLFKKWICDPMNAQLLLNFQATRVAFWGIRRHTLNESYRLRVLWCAADRFIYLRTRYLESPLSSLQRVNDRGIQEAIARDPEPPRYRGPGRVLGTTT